MKYLLWFAYSTYANFWKAPGQGSTTCVHLAHLYSAEEAVEMLKSNNTDPNNPTLFALIAPDQEELVKAAKRERADPIKLIPPKDDAKYLIWDNDDEGFWYNNGDGFYGGIVRVTHTAGLYTAEQVQETLAEYEGETAGGLPTITPLLAPNMAQARADFERATF